MIFIFFNIINPRTQKYLKNQLGFDYNVARRTHISVAWIKALRVSPVAHEVRAQLHALHGTALPLKLHHADRTYLSVASILIVVHRK